MEGRDLRRRKALRNVTRLLRSPDFRAMLPADDLPVVVALGDDSLVSVCHGVRPEAGTIRVVVVMERGTAVLEVDSTIAHSDLHMLHTGSEDGPHVFHPDAELAMLLEYMKASKQRMIAFRLGRDTANVTLLQEPMEELVVP